MPKITINLPGEQAEWYARLQASSEMGHSDLVKFALSLVAACAGLPPCPIGRGPGNPDRTELPATTPGIQGHAAFAISYIFI